MSQSNFAAGTEASLPPIVIPPPRIPAQMRGDAANIEAHYAAMAEEAAAASAAAASAAAGTPPEALAPVTPPSNEQGRPPETETAPPALPPEAPAEGSWEHRYNSSQGRLRHALARTELLEGENARLAGENAALKLSTPVNQQIPGALPDLTQDEIDQLGPDLVDMINRRATIIARGELSRLEAGMAEMRTTLATTTQHRAANTQQAFVEDLDAAVPAWRVINTDQSFINWCGEYDVMRGATRKEMLLSAFKKCDLEAVVAIFKLFGNNPLATPAGAGTPQAPGAQPQRLPLEALAAPGRGPTATLAQGAPPPQANHWTGADITRFYHDVSRGVFIGQEAKQREYEADLMLAQAEGRVRP